MWIAYTSNLLSAEHMPRRQRSLSYCRLRLHPLRPFWVTMGIPGTGNMLWYSGVDSWRRFLMCSSWMFRASVLPSAARLGVVRVRSRLSNCQSSWKLTKIRRYKIGWPAAYQARPTRSVLANHARRLLKVYWLAAERSCLAQANPRTVTRTSAGSCDMRAVGSPWPGRKRGDKRHTQPRTWHRIIPKALGGKWSFTSSFICLSFDHQAKLAWQQRGQR